MGGGFKYNWTNFDANWRIEIWIAANGAKRKKKQRQEGHTRAVLAVQCSDFLFVKFVLIKEDGLIKSKGKSEREGEPTDV